MPKALASRSRPTGQSMSYGASLPLSRTASNNAIVFVKSTDGGKTFTTPRVIRLIHGYGRSDVLASGARARDCGSGPFLCLSGFTFHRSDSLPQAVADKHGNVYVTWEEVTPAPDNGDTYHPDGQSQVVLTKSADGGASLEHACED